MLKTETDSPPPKPALPPRISLSEKMVTSSVELPRSGTWVFSVASVSFFLSFHVQSFTSWCCFWKNLLHASGSLHFTTSPPRHASWTRVIVTAPDRFQTRAFPTRPAPQPERCIGNADTATSQSAETHPGAAGPRPAGGRAPVQPLASGAPRATAADRSKPRAWSPVPLSSCSCPPPVSLAAELSLGPQLSASSLPGRPCPPSVPVLC